MCDEQPSLRFLFCLILKANDHVGKAALGGPAERSSPAPTQRRRQRHSFAALHFSGAPRPFLGELSGTSFCYSNCRKPSRNPNPMPTLIAQPTRIQSAGNKPKLIDEYIGRGLNSCGLGDECR